MNNKSKDILVIFVLLISLSALAVSSFVLISQKDMQKKLISIAKGLDELKFDIQNLKKFKSNASIDDTDRNTDMAVLQEKLKNMRSELEYLKKNDGVKALEEYKKEKNSFWINYAEEIKKSWTAYLQNALAAKGISSDDIEQIKYDYGIMLDKMRDEQLLWYDSDSPVDELNEKMQDYAKEFYDDMSESVGEQKASITLSIVFPDQLYRKSLFKEDQ